MDSKEIYTNIDKILTILENNFRYKYGKKTWNSNQEPESEYPFQGYAF